MDCVEGNFKVLWMELHIKSTAKDTEEVRVKDNTDKVIHAGKCCGIKLVNLGVKKKKPTT